jgi:hypothetical protein
MLSIFSINLYVMHICFPSKLINWVFIGFRSATGRHVEELNLVDDYLWPLQDVRMQWAADELSGRIPKHEEVMTCGAGDNK